MDPSATVFSATGTIQTYLVPATGGYLIEACGAQAAAPGDGGGAKGDRVRGLFYLHRGDVLKIAVGSRLPRGLALRRIAYGGDGGSVVWRGPGELPVPAKLMLAGGGGLHGTGAAPDPAGWGDSFNAGAFQANAPGVHAGDGHVSIAAVPTDPVFPFGSAPSAGARTAAQTV